jgi:hypothetical protein
LSVGENPSVSVAGQGGSFNRFSRRRIVPERKSAASDDQADGAGDEGLRKVLAVLACQSKGLGDLSAALEGSRADRDELLILDGVEGSELRAEFLCLGEPLPDSLGPPEHRKSPSAMFRELVPQHRMVEVAEHHESLVDDVQGCMGLIGGDFENGQDVVSIRVPQRRGHFAGDTDGLERMMAALVEAAHAAKRDRQVRVRSHRQSPSRRDADERRGVLFGRSARISEPHRQVSQCHCHGCAPSAVLNPLRHVLGESERFRGKVEALLASVQLRLRQMDVELLAKPGAP